MNAPSSASDGVTDGSRLGDPASVSLSLVGWLDTEAAHRLGCLSPSVQPMELRDQLQQTLGTAYTIERELGGGDVSHVADPPPRHAGVRALHPRTPGMTDTFNLSTDGDRATVGLDPHDMRLGRDVGEVG